VYQRWNHVCTLLLLCFGGCALFPQRARCQTESFDALRFSPSPIERAFLIPSAGDFKFATAPPVRFERYERREYWAGLSATDGASDEAAGGWPQSQSQSQTQNTARDGLVKRSVKRTLQDQKELYFTPFKPSNFKWDLLVLGTTAPLLAYDRHIEKHIDTSYQSSFQTTSDIAIGGLSGALVAVYAWGIKGNHPHAKETGALELETLVNTFLIYTPMQLIGARQRPDEGNGNGDFWKHHAINTSFPGGHAMFTFAMATVVSHEYPQKWVQVLAYSAASIVTVSRFMARDHWSSDMLVGSALGIGIGSHIFHAHCNPDLSDSCKRHVRWIF
jgi:hypothetical protein